MTINDTFNNLDLIQVYNNNRVIMTIPGKDFEGKTKKELAEHLGKTYPNQKLYIAYYISGQNVKRSPITTITYDSQKAIASDLPPAANNSGQNLGHLQDFISDLKEELKELKAENNRYRDKLFDAMLEDKAEGNSNLNQYLPLIMQMLSKGKQQMPFFSR